MKNTAEVVSIGNEILIGQTLDTNSNWIARQLSRSGWSLQRVTILGDSLDVISQGVREAVERAPELLITVGGLGPTYDDMTLKGLSMAIHRRLTLNEKALEFIKDRYRTIDSPTVLTPHRRKMAILPKGSRPLPNPVGTAPGVLTKLRQTAIVSLPGVPTEMKAIFRGSVIPVLGKSRRGSPQEVYLKLIGIVESALAPLLEQAQRKFPSLYFKSHPRGTETWAKSLILLHIYTLGGINAHKIGEAVTFLLNGLASSGAPH